MDTKHLVFGFLALGWAAAGCADVSAQERGKGWELAVFEYARIRLATEESERYRWITAGSEVERDGVHGMWSELGLDEAPATNPASDRVRLLEHLTAQGWELVTVNDVSFVLAGGTAFAHRYHFRRRR